MREAVATSQPGAAWWRRRPALVGGGALAALSFGVFALGAGFVTGSLRVVLAAVLLALVIGLVAVAILGGSDVRKQLAPYGLLKPGVLWLALFYLAPLWALFVMSLSSKESRFDFTYDFTWEWSNYKTALSDFGEQFTRAFGYAGVATLLCILIGYPLAYVIAFRGGKYKNLLLGMVVVPFFTSYLIRTIAWKSLLADTGPIISVLETFGLMGLFDTLGIVQNGGIINTPAAVIGGLTYNFLPFMVLPIYVSLEKIDPRLVDAAKDLYCPGPRAFRKVVLPLSLPGVFAGTLLTYIPASGDFINAELLGSPNTTMIGNSIQDQFLKLNNYPLASAMSFVLMFVITIAVLIYARVLGTEDLT
ncbi:MAG TPA: ABC transporter permease [Acidimicrobiales bacterium]